MEQGKRGGDSEVVARWELEKEGKEKRKRVKP